MLLILYCLPISLFSQTEKNPCETLSEISKYIQENHYRPKPIDDSLSVYVFRTFLSKLDDDNRLFLESEIETLKVHQYKIDDYIKSKNCLFLTDFYTAYNNAVSRYKNVIVSLKNDSFPKSYDEKIIFSKKVFPYSKTESELKKIYLKRILFNTIRDISELSTNKDSLAPHYEKLFSEYNLKVFDKFECKVQNYQITQDQFNEHFYASFCSYFDPHTEYFSDSEKSAFLSSVSSDNLTFGLYVSMSEKDEMTVDDIIPGSSAYFTGKIDKGDKLLKIKYENEEYEIVCASIKKIDEIISSNKYKTADFTFRKKSGEVYNVNLEKKLLRDYQNNAFSYKIKKGSSTFGYIRIPSFYSTFDYGKSNLSFDVVKEVYKLQADNVDGMIVDVENNGGGSMEEAIRLSGLFIDRGPLAVLQDKNNKTEVLKDNYKGVIYNGPMVVMINGFSASASEFFANAMQDYNRAIIIGNQSLGKASMQRIYPIGKNDEEFLKLTLEKFYRITGKSNQTIGITPDVEIPSLFNKQMPRENSNPTALKNDQIKIKLRYNRILNESYTKAVQASKTRVLNDKEFKAINLLNAEINPLFDDALPPIELTFDAIYNDVSKINTLWKEIEKVAETKYPMLVESNAVDAGSQQSDEYLKSCNLERIKDIKRNLHIFEAVNILEDIKHLK